MDQTLRQTLENKVARYSAQACRAAIADCHNTLEVGQYPYEHEYAQKLWAEIDACRDRLHRIYRGE